MVQLASEPKYLLPQRVERTSGVGAATDLGPLRGKLLVVTLGINDVLEHEGLVVSIWGSATGTDWGTRPLLTFPQKSYCGQYATLLNLANHPAVKFLRVEWKMSRWAQRNSDVLFGFHVCMSDSLSRVHSAVA